MEPPGLQVTDHESMSADEPGNILGTGRDRQGTIVREKGTAAAVAPEDVPVMRPMNSRGSAGLAATITLWPRGGGGTFKNACTNGLKLGSLAAGGVWEERRAGRSAHRGGDNGSAVSNTAVGSGSGAGAGAGAEAAASPQDGLVHSSGIAIMSMSPLLAFL
eukprot:CAMPEP_0115673428 /NCGR_PEP_ID=MMETSP0272-20121206/53092_1 /TAXON_ID=71861 /ORGANISM="Scrippsiella trochoidea, Strain CCMP3099" /LENGTH=160 /DNA_ID=CAMNT_0003112289 /DNA_START=293 /DNA_END=776 /DNA_ORIENTATION=-